LIKVQSLRDVLIKDHVQVELLLLSLDLVHLENLANELSNVSRLDVKNKLFGLDLCVVKDVVDHGYQVLRVASEGHLKLLQFSTHVVSSHLAEELRARIDLCEWVPQVMHNTCYIVNVVLDLFFESLDQSETCFVSRHLFPVLECGSRDYHSL
jgi:hypothetical protein